MAGKPVVAYDIRGVREVVDPASGLLVPRGDVRGLTAVVEELLGDPERRATLGKAGRERVSERFSEDDVITRLREIYAGCRRPRERPWTANASV